MNFGIISYKSLLGKILRLPLKLIPKTTILPICQGQLRGFKWIVGSHFHGCWLGSYEYDKRKLFESSVKKGNIVFDIGANVGFYSLLSSVLVGESGQVFAFEPVKRNLYFLKKHLEMNHIKNITIYDVAVGDHKGIIFIDDNPTYIGQLNYGSCHISDSGSTKVNMIYLDDLYEKGEIPLPDFIKIDVEGAEKMVLKGGEKLLRESNPIIFLATHGKAVHKECCEYLGHLGYTLDVFDLKDNIETTDEILAYKTRKNVGNSNENRVRCNVT